MNRLLTWSFLTQLSSAVVVGQCGTQFALKLNSLNQPSTTGGTHKPYGYNQMAAIYGQYIVHAVEVELAIQASQSQTQPYSIAIDVQPSNSVFALTGKAMSDIIEQTSGTVVHGDCTGITTYKKFRFPMHQIEGITVAQYLDELDDYSGSTSAGNPTKTPFLNLALSNNWDTTALSASVFVKLRFEAEFYQRTTLASSN